ncbi:hypothetical protein AKJ09_02618 [Labilithrix luteola]|uniref:Outer membrane lipoprotein BamD-like domain-containing protein n=1 Tax=Labilithrix luteola TaxID=1391654 RepID=A0A0K1PS49_9BACT|nr:hypothetical protein [Labilithrix luteola]AKU95954.1 hypothetical protein AKJ09_02618 [Labilithrix luteola]
MTDGPTRRIFEDPEFARLVDASENDGPSSAQIDKALSRVSHMASPARMTWSWWKAGLVIGVAVAGVFTRVDVGTPRNEAVGGVSLSPPPSMSATTVEAVPPPTVSVNDLAAAPIAAPPQQLAANARASVPPERRPKEGTTFDDELALVSHARAALEAKDARSCLRSVERYEQRFRSGLFAPEVEVMHIEALALSGERVRARTWAERFLTANPTSPYTKRVRSVIERLQD